MTTSRRAWFGLLLAGALGVASAQGLPVGAPEGAGVSAARLDRIGEALQRAVDSGELPGAVVAVARRGKIVYQKSVGWRDWERKVAMSNDAIFRMYSMTKPIVSVAAMMLVEEGRLSLDEPVWKYIPEFRDMRVAVDSSDPAGGTSQLVTVPAKRDITVHDLLRHTSGLTYGVLGTMTPVKQAYIDAEIFSQHWVLADWARAIAKLPLAFEPGTTFEYSHSTDVLGRVIEVASGQTLDVFLNERILGPLGMKDTAWEVAPDKVDRLAQPRPDVYTGQTPKMLDLTAKATFFAGGHGLVSTASDYIRFCQMMVNGGTLDGVRILGPKTVAFMASNHLHAGISPGPNYIPGPGYGFGLGFAVRLETGQSDWPATVGEYFWAGAGGTYFWIDPKEQLVAVLLSQEPTRRQHYRVLFRDLVYQSLAE
jgi:CubicO group peptidase (beta-lactamase class C family)